MRRLAADIGEALLLTRLAGSAVICLEREDAATQAVGISHERGQLRPINAGASASALLAWLPKAEIKTVLRRARLEANSPRRWSRCSR